MNPAPRRFVSLGAAALLQVLLAYGLYVGLMPAFDLIVPKVLIAHVIEAATPPRPVPVLPDSGRSIEVTLPVIPMPLVPAPTAEPAPITLVVTGPIATAPTALPTPHAAEVFARLDPQRKNPQPDYPATSVRLKEEGTTILSIFIDERGFVMQAQLLTTSGSPRLDEAAIRGVTTRGAKRWHYLPATKDGGAIGVWQTVTVRWELKRAGY